MYKPADMSTWQGRVDALEGDWGTRWHQRIEPLAPVSPPGLALLGFASDEGVRRNQGRVGACQGPAALRKALANLAWHQTQPLYDAGDVHCSDGDLAGAQQELAAQVCSLFAAGHFPLVLGGGHEVAYGSWQGLNAWAGQQVQQPVIGIVNLDAHFDLRAYEDEGSSGTPFKQIADQCAASAQPFRYCCLGVAQTANTQALFRRADELGVSYRLDEAMGLAQLDETRAQLQAFMQRCDWLYLTIDLDVLPAAVAPGVSAPAARGVALEVVEALIADVKASGKLQLADLAELNPNLDIDQHTARSAARLAYLIAR